MPYQPKYQTGQIVETNGTGEGIEHTGFSVVIIGTWKFLGKYNACNYGFRERCDESCPERVIYATYEIESGRVWWYFETDINLCCEDIERDVKRGKSIIFQNIDMICREYYIYDEYKKKFINFLKDYAD
jgi:hypothetical protein